MPSCRSMVATLILEMRLPRFRCCAAGYIPEGGSGSTRRILDLDASWTGSSIAAPTRPCRTGCRPRRGSPPSPTPSANGPHPCRCGSEPTGLVRGPCRRGRPGPAVGASRARRASARHPRRGRAGSGTSDSRVAAPRAATKPPSPDRAGTELTAQVLTVVHAMTAERHSGSAASGTSCCPRYQ